jgi:hypothetical protein
MWGCHGHKSVGLHGGEVVRLGGAGLKTRSYRCIELFKVRFFVSLRMTNRRAPRNDEILLEECSTRTWVYYIEKNKAVRMKVAQIADLNLRGNEVGKD